MVSKQPNPIRYTPPATTTTPDLTDAWYAGQVLPQMIPGLRWLMKPERAERRVETDAPIMQPDNLARIEAEYRAWVRTWKEPT